MTDQRTGGASVHLEGVAKSYGSVEVLHGVSISVPAGSFTTFLGPSGSGKTTTLAITTGLVRPDRGRVLIAGKDCTATPVHKRDLGFVFQSYALFPHMSVEKNVAYPLKLRGVPKAERRMRVGEALELVRLSGYERHYPAQLSGGQQQRVALARAVVFRPRVLLMDEPLGALDAGLRVHLQREIVRIGRELGVTILYVTHDQTEALTMSDQIVLFHDGNIEQMSAPQELYSAPRSAFAARFMGNAALLPGTVDGPADAPVLRHALGQTRVAREAVERLGLTAGAGALGVMRSEFLTLDRPGAARGAGGTHVGAGTVTDVIYAGARQRVAVKLDDGTDLEYYFDTNDATPCWSVGERLDVGVRADRLPPVVPADAAAPPAPRDEATVPAEVPVALPRTEVSR